MSSKVTRDPMVHSPKHYNQGSVEAIDAIRSALGEEGFRAYCRGNALKYIHRAEDKGNLKQDINKAIWYLRMAINNDPRLDDLVAPQDADPVDWS